MNRKIIIIIIVFFLGTGFFRVDSNKTNPSCSILNPDEVFSGNFSIVVCHAENSVLTFFNNDVLEAQDKPAAFSDILENADKNSENLEKSMLIKVMFITLLTWTGLAVYIFSLHRKVRFLEKKLED